MIKERLYHSRLQRKQVAHQWRVAGFWIFLSAAVITGVLIYGVPIFIGLATWYADYKAGENPIVVDDNLPPAPPRMRLPFSATNSAVLDLSGFAEAGSTVKIFLNQQEVKSVVTEADGKFLLTGLQLESGFNSIYATAIDEAQNVSAESRREEILFDNKPPQLVVESPADGGEFYGSGQKRVEVKGKTDADAQVTVNTRSMIVGQDGSFGTFVNLEVGEQVLVVKSIDVAGNETVKEVKVRYQM